MHRVYSVLAVVLLALSLLHLHDSNLGLWIGFYGSGAGLAAMVCKANLGLGILRVLAMTSVVTMFSYFCGFFLCAPYLSEAWYVTEAHGGTLALLIAGFCMMPVVAAYSCRMKALFSSA